MPGCGASDLHVAFCGRIVRSDCAVGLCSLDYGLPNDGFSAFTVISRGRLAIVTEHLRCLIINRFDLPDCVVDVMLVMYERTSLLNDATT